MKRISKGLSAFFSLSLVIILAACDYSSTSSNDDTSSSTTSSTSGYFTVTWVNYDDTVLEIDENVKYGTWPSYDGETPTKPRDAQYTYIFDSWTPDRKMVTEDITYKATYKTTINTYTVTWMCENNVLKIDEVAYGDVPSYDGETPTKESDEKYNYVFVGWTPEIKPVDGNAVYYAVFNKETNKYTVTWKNYDGSVFGYEELEYGATPYYDGETPTRSHDPFYSYEFVGWSPEIQEVQGPQEYIAQYEIVGCENFSFELNETGTNYTVTDYIGENGKDVRIPNEYKGLPVSKIATSAFSNKSISNVFIPNTIETVDENAFYGCVDTKIYLEASEIPEGFASDWNPSNARIITGISGFDDTDFIYKLVSDKATIVGYCGEDVDLYIPNKISHLNQEYSVDSISNSTFYDCSSLITVTFEGNSQLTSIDSYAFAYCSKLTSIIIPSSVTSIGNSAFYGCSSLTSIIIPSSVTSIGIYAFSDCTSLIIYCETSSQPEDWSSNWNPSNRPVVWGYAGVNGVTDDGFIYAVSLDEQKNKNAIITGYNGESTAAVIPSLINIDEEDIPVTSIHDIAFRSNSSLTSITIPSSVTSIGNFTFRDCSSIELVTFGDNSQLTSIGGYTFYGCSKLTSITIPNSVTSIGDLIFYRCTSLESVTFEDDSQLTSIGSSAFAYCSKLTSIIIPSSIASIGIYAFSDCTSLTSVTFEDNSQLISIGNSAFSGCSSLTSITIPSSVTSIGNSAFNNCSSLVLITIPASVTSIGNDAFNNCSSLIICCETTSQLDGWSSSWNPSNRPVYWDVSGITNEGFIYTVSQDEQENKYIVINGYIGESTALVIPSSINVNGEDIPVTSIANSAFSGSSSLISIIIPSSVTSIGDDAFYDCSSLTIYCEATSQPDGWSSSWNSSDRPVHWGVSGIIDNGFIYQLDNSEATVIGYIGDGTALAIPSSINVNGEDIPVTSIGDNAFYNYSSLTLITISSSITSIGDNAFYGCSSLIICCEATSQPDGWSSSWNPSDRPVYWGVSGIIDNGFIYQLDDSEATVIGYVGESTAAVIPSSINVNGEDIPVTSIGNDAFKYSSLTSIFIPSSITSIGDNAFYQCRSLVKVIFEKNSQLTSIGMSAFHTCVALVSIIIPSSVTSIGNYAFASCSSLTIYCEASSKPSGWDSYWNSYNRPVVWRYTGINGTTDDGIEYAVICDEEGNKYITIVGYIGESTAVVIPSSININGEDIPVTTIGGYAFKKCTSLTSVVIPSSVTSIGNYAFYDCSSLTIYCEASSKPSGWDSYWNSYNRPVVWGYTGISAVTDDGFKYAVSQDEDGNKYITILGYVGESTAIEIPSSINVDGEDIPVTLIGSYAFTYSSLTSITIPSSVTSIGYEALSNCYSLTSVIFEDNSQLTSIGGYAFAYCSKLTSIIIPSSVTSIGERAFRSCSSLTSIIIPLSVTSIGINVFFGCSSLTIYCEASSQPDGWDSSWNSSYRPVVWGYNAE